jgi:hypothetical protein
LFNIAIDPIIRNVQGEDNEQKILAYADDLVLLSNNQENMQKRLDETELLAVRIYIKINPMKSFSMHLSGVTPVGTRDTTEQLLLVVRERTYIIRMNFSRQGSRVLITKNTNTNIKITLRR